MSYCYDSNMRNEINLAGQQIEYEIDERLKPHENSAYTSKI
jgi:hypothetical protein